MAKQRRHRQLTKRGRHHDPGAVDTADYNFWRSRFGFTSGAGAGLGSSNIPEPASFVLIGPHCRPRRCRTPYRQSSKVKNPNVRLNGIMGNLIQKVRRTLVAWLVLTVFAPAIASAVAEADQPVYLFTSFRGNGEDGLRFLRSDDGYRWKKFPHSKPAVGPSRLMRDPSLALGPDGTFHLVWTTGWQKDHGFGYAHSKDLVNWSEQRFIPVMEHEPTTVNVWAPELFYDRTKRAIHHLLGFDDSRPISGPPGAARQQSAHVLHDDARLPEFAPTKLFFDPGFSVIDCTIVKDDDRYVLVLKDNTRPQRNLRVAFGDSPLGPWRECLHRSRRTSRKARAC